MGVNKKSILIIDDTPENIEVMRGILQSEYRLQFALNGKEGFRLATSEPYPDLILLDIMMPDYSGYEVCRDLKKHDEAKQIPVIFVTAKGEVEDEAKGFSLGAVDYITKPVSPVIVHARISNHLFIRDQQYHLEKQVQQRTHEISKLQDVTIQALASLAETRDLETGRHIKRTQLYVKELAKQLVRMNMFKDILTDEYIELIHKTAPLHDIGKVGVADSILLKPGPLTEDEMKEMKKHVMYGYRSLEMAQSNSGRNSYITLALELIRDHHESWDGTGYPRGVSGEEISLAGRIMALADTYDALRMKRVYKSSKSHEETVQIIIGEMGRRFDPVIVNAFTAVSDHFNKISHTFKD